jgi:hypothetical protein
MIARIRSGSVIQNFGSGSRRLINSGSTGSESKPLTETFFFVRRWSTLKDYAPATWIEGPNLGHKEPNDLNYGTVTVLSLPMTL